MQVSLKFIFATFLCLVGLPSSSLSQVGGAGSGGLATPAEEEESKFLEWLMDNSDELSEENNKLLQEYIETRLKYGVARSQAGIESIAQTQRLIAWENKASFISFLLAHIAVLIGFAGASVEFLHANRLRRQGRGQDDTEITVKLESVAVKTTSIGVILLMSSIVFYLLYLKYVHPIYIVPL